MLVTPFNADYPLLRFATGDLSAVLPGPSPCGRTNVRIKGWMGRADQTTKIRGMFVHPSQVAEIVRRFPEVARARLVVSGEMANDHMTLKVEAAGAAQQCVPVLSTRNALQAIDGGAQCGFQLRLRACTCGQCEVRSVVQRGCIALAPQYAIDPQLAIAGAGGEVAIVTLDDGKALTVERFPAPSLRTRSSTCRATTGAPAWGCRRGGRPGARHPPACPSAPASPAARRRCARREGHGGTARRLRTPAPGTPRS